MVPRSKFGLAAGFFALISTLASAQNRIDVVTPLAPELSAYGPLPIGVRTLLVTDRNRPDVLNTRQGEAVPRYDRTLTLEVWYPASLKPDQKPGGEYKGVITRDPSVVVTLRGQAVRDALPRPQPGGYPLVVVSHGYPGDRHLMAHLGENLASKGYVVASISHKESTYDDQKAFASTLYHRPFDQLFVVNEVERLSGREGSSFLFGLVDASRTGIVGYSMGGYGVVNVIGGGFRKGVESLPLAPPNGLLAERTASHPGYLETRDARVKAAIAIAPWGMQIGAWDGEGLKGIHTPVLFVAGSGDDVSGYEKGTRAIYEGALNTTRYLLTFIGAGHNAGAPIAAPEETYASRNGQPAGFTHYADPVWDTVRMNNILDHFSTAFLDLYLKGEASRLAYLDIVPQGKDAVFAEDREGKPQPSHTYWKGFKRRTAAGLTFESLRPAR